VGTFSQPGLAPVLLIRGQSSSITATQEESEINEFSRQRSTSERLGQDLLYQENFYVARSNNSYPIPRCITFLIALSLSVFAWR